MRRGSPPKGSAPALITIEGVLERVTYANDENAWCVVKLVVAGQTDLVTAVGNLLGVQPGEGCASPAGGRPTRSTASSSRSSRTSR